MVGYMPCAMPCGSGRAELSSRYIYMEGKAMPRHRWGGEKEF